ncbi:MAG: hypothetical protein E6G06_06795 [Actinobacteria bacterium]|nr:MAG: hypothetical protein E6G06_06795 [Actinomycetota bacterium]
MNEQRARPAPEATSRAHDVVAHLQAAALEMIAAARAFLDVAEDLVKEPGEATAMAATLANIAGRIVPPSPGGHEQSPAGSGGHEQSPAGSGGHEQSPGVEHIRVS